MDVQAQVQALIDEAPDDQSTQEGIQVVADVLGQVASSLGHTQYYILQSFQQQWQVTTLQHRSQAELHKTVLYAYGHLSDATRMGQAQELIAVPVKIVPLLFQFFSFAEVDSLLFLDEANNLDQIRELKRQDLQTLVQSYLEQYVQERDESIAQDLTDIV